MNDNKKFDLKQLVLSALSTFACAVTIPEILHVANSNGKPKLSLAETEALLKKMTLDREIRKFPVERYQCHHIWHDTTKSKKARCSRCGRVTTFEEVKNLYREEVYYFLQEQKDFVSDVAIAGELGLGMPEVKKSLEQLGDKVQTDGDGNWRSILVVPVEIVKDDIVKSEESDLDRLLKLETELQQIERQYFLGAGKRYVEIIDAQLYKKVGYDNFKNYCTERLGMSYRRVRQLVDAYRLVGELEARKTTNIEVNQGSPLPLPTSERQCRELLKLKTSEERVKLWFEAVKDKKNGRIPAREIKELVEQKKKMEQSKRYNPRIERFKVGDVVRVTAKNNKNLKEFHSCWGQIFSREEHSYTILTWKGAISEVAHDDLMAIKQASQKVAKTALSQLNRLYSAWKHDPDVVALLHYLGTKPQPGISQGGSIALDSLEFAAQTSK